MLQRLRDWLDDPRFPPHSQPDRPGVTLSYAQSIDGSLTSRRGQPTAISSEESTAATHLIRSGHQGILVGIGTVLSDNPRLSVRPPAGQQPRPVLIDPHLRTPPDARIFDSRRQPLILHGPDSPTANRGALVELGAELVAVPAEESGHLVLAEALRIVRTAGITTLMVEGGAKILASFLAAGLWDRAAVTIAPRWIGGYLIPLNRFSGARLDEAEWVAAGPDVLCLGWRLT